MKASEIIANINSTASKQTYTTIEKAIAEIKKESLSGTEIELNHSEYI